MHKNRPGQIHLYGPREFRHELRPWIQPYDHIHPRLDNRSSIVLPVRPPRLSPNQVAAMLAIRSNLRDELGHDLPETNEMRRTRSSHRVVVRLFGCERHLPPQAIANDLWMSQWYPASTKFLLEFGARFPPKELFRVQPDLAGMPIVALASQYLDGTLQANPALYNKDGAWELDLVHLWAARTERLPALFLAWSYPH